MNQRVPQPPRVQKLKLRSLAARIIACERCPRLRTHCRKIAEQKRKAFQSEVYWAKPVPGFGDPLARVILVGLAPAAHGANRTGRIFTGDRSGAWLYRALHQQGFANQAQSTSCHDGLTLEDAWVTCAVHCAPPDNKPRPAEFTACSRYLSEELAILSPRAVVYIALGGVALKALWPLISPTGSRRPRFAHGARVALGDGRTLLMSYHPSQQNTFTGRLTEPMFDSIFLEARRLLPGTYP
jgi:uracil-DNA glycosylase family 4